MYKFKPISFKAIAFFLYFVDVFFFTKYADPFQMVYHTLHGHSVYILNLAKRDDSPQC